jgi:hypothetical protein
MAWANKEEGLARFREDHLKRGLCSLCCNPRLEGKTICQKCAENHRQTNAERREDHMRRGLCLVCDNPRRSGRSYCSVCAAERAQYARGYNAALKKRVMAEYGGKCAWDGCGITDVDVLTLDHIQNNGAQARNAKVHGSGSSLYRALERLGYPKGEFQILCCNHQLKKQILMLRGEKVHCEAGSSVNLPGGKSVYGYREVTIN